MDTCPLRKFCGMHGLRTYFLELCSNGGFVCFGGIVLLNYDHVLSEYFFLVILKNFKEVVGL